MTRRRGTPGRLGAAVLGAVLLLSAADASDMQQAREAMATARSYKGQGDLRRARHMFELVMTNSPEESTIHREAKDELEYYIPLMQIQRLLWQGSYESAERRLLDLQLTFEHSPLRRQEIGRILAGLREASSRAGTDADPEVDEKLALRETGRRLETHFRRHGRYPTDRSTLDEALDLDSGPLNAFEVERYSSNGAGYLLVLRHRKDPTQTLTLQRTGLLQ